MSTSSSTALADLFAAQRAHRPEVKRATADERVDKLRRLRTAIVERKSDLQRAMFADFRKPAFEVDFTEITSVLMEIDHSMGHLQGWMRPRRVGTPLDLFGTSKAGLASSTDDKPTGEQQH